AARLLDVADPERQTESRRRLKFDAGIHAGDRQRAGFGVERRERAADAGIVFQRVETGIKGDGQAAALQAVAELNAFAIERAETAGRTLAETAEAQAAALAADKKAVRKIVARVGRAVSDVAEVEARKAPVSVRALACIAAKTHRPAGNPVIHRRSLGVGRSRAQAQHRHNRRNT